MFDVDLYNPCPALFKSQNLKVNSTNYIRDTTFVAKNVWQKPLRVYDFIVFMFASAVPRFWFHTSPRARPLPLHTPGAASSVIWPLHTFLRAGADVRCSHIQEQMPHTRVSALRLQRWQMTAACSLPV